ncbi:heat shock 70 kDa protein 16 [Amaranthus tricolor]|uniref:heat shock 70 kDa protein 16 n=1 Tax=Amaranthus tricolor TaxID=29722 RepID=UPI002590D79E|nr:heat shock 70 kDa protein 16 [Amaranthus tricolor]XP_057544376.1 heat shock 70 kDa protein 16 [Amaranthus tricolor]XP_057544377.1 heat shock 70 kDa protein 16 [Amaranthus tricolor]
MSVVGFDIGNENCVVAAVIQRGIDVLLNEESKRETPGVVSFGEKQRLFGSAAVASATMNPTSTIYQVKRLLGRRFDHPKVQDDLRLFPFGTSEGPDGGILIHVQYLGEQHNFTPVQLLAMLFSHLKQTAEKSLEAPFKDCVIGIPSYFTNLQRCLYLDAAAIAGLKPIRLLHDCTATALGYGIYKTDFSDKGPSYAAFVDIGHSDTQVAVVAFAPGHMKVLSHASDSNLGGRDFDEVLFRHFAGLFKQNYNIDIYSSRRACIRLRLACEKLKKVLSANLEAPLNIECLMDEKDVKGFITRDEFEKLSSDLLKGIAEPCQKALIDSGVAVEKIQSVELVGSGSRIPAITRVLSSVFGKEPSRKLNASECVARGCALQCAMFSPNFRVKDYQVEDSQPFSIGFCLLEDGPIHALPNGVLFPKGHSIPSEKVLTMCKSSEFQMEAFYVDEHELPPGVSPKISIFKIGPFPVADTESANVKVKAVLTLDGTVTLQSAFLVGGSVDEPVMRSNPDISSGSMEAEFENQSPDAEISAVDKHFASKPFSASYNHNRKDKTMARLALPIDECVLGRTTDTEFLKATEAALADQDYKVEQAKEKKNTLESYVYETRNKILSTYKDYTSEPEKAAICEKLQQTEDWLYEDGVDESAHVYADRLHDLKKLVDPIKYRYKENESWQHAVNTAVDTIKECQIAARSLTDNEKETVLAECTNLEQWLRGATQEHDLQPKYDDPVICSRDIEESAKKLREFCRHKLNAKGYHGGSDDNAYSDHKSKGDDMQVD